MTPAIRCFVVMTSVVFWSLVVLSLGVVPVAQGQSLLVVAPLLGIAIAAEALMISREESSASFSVAAHIAAAILFGPLAAALVASLAVIVVDGLRLGPRSPVFLNASVFGLSAWAGGWAFLVTGGTVGALSPSEIVPIIALIAVRFVVNEVLISIAISLASGLRMLHVLRDELRDLVGAAMGEGCLGVLVAFGYSAGQWMILPFLVPLLATLYRSQLNLDKLRRETAAALNAFAGVIDERDVHTARHSERVADYVERLCAAIQLPDKEAARLVKAARFHDLGKVAIDVATLTREGRLTPAELRAIRSHPRLSARLLSPFHFAQEMAIYAELHHERYDGKGYYSVPQREIPVEAHVLIVADSFDAMTSVRTYRPALTREQAVQELRDKAGSQFHPLVAHAFAAMIEHREVFDAIGSAQLAALRQEFSRVPMISLPPLHRLLHPRLLAVGTISGLLVALGLPDVPPGIILATGVAAVVSTSTAIWMAVSQSRRRRRMGASTKSSESVDAALLAAGIPGSGLWLRFDHESECYAPRLESSESISHADLDELCKRASRAAYVIETGQLESGRHYAVTPITANPRLAVCANRALTPFEQELVLELGTQAVATTPSHTALPRIEHTDDRGNRQASITVELRAFEDIRAVAGQLIAERVIQDAAARIQTLLREGDSAKVIHEDTLGIIVSVSNERELNAICDRIHAILTDVSLPTGARPLSPSLRAELNPDSAGAALTQVAPTLRAAG